MEMRNNVKKYWFDSEIHKKTIKEISEISKKGKYEHTIFVDDEIMKCKDLANFGFFMITYGLSSSVTCGKDANRLGKVTNQLKFDWL